LMESPLLRYRILLCTFQDLHDFRPLPLLHPPLIVFLLVLLMPLFVLAHLLPILAEVLPLLQQKLLALLFVFGFAEELAFLRHLLA
jgi:hypothetical protein